MCVCVCACACVLVCIKMWGKNLFIMYLGTHCCKNVLCERSANTMHKQYH